MPGPYAARDWRTGRLLPGRWMDLVSPLPRDVGNDNREFAARRAEEFAAVLARGGWTQTERNILRAHRARWWRRAQGRDPRYKVAGIWAGRLTRAQERAVRLARAIQADVDRVAKAAARRAHRTPRPSWRVRWATEQVLRGGSDGKAR